MSGTGTMPKKPQKAKPGPKPKPGVTKREALVTFKCRPEYKAWLIRFSEAQRDIPSRMIDLGLIKLAESLGFEPPPKR